MNNDKMSDTEEMLQNLFSMGKKIYPIAESLRVKLNAIIAEQQVDAHAVSMALAYLAAGYVHQIKQMYDDPDTHDTIEDLFIGNFKMFLGMLDATDVRNEVEKMKREELN